MGLFESLRLSFEGLRSNKMRAILTMLGIIIGIAAVIGILTVGDGLSGSITGTMSSFGASTITVSLRQKDQDAPAPEEEDLISMEMIDELRTRHGSEISYITLSQSVGNGQAKDGRLYANVSLSGVNAEYFPANETTLLAGRFFERERYGGQPHDLRGQRQVGEQPLRR